MCTCTHCLYSDYKEYHTDTTVKFVVHLTADKMAEVERVGYHKKLKLETYLNTSNLVYNIYDKSSATAHSTPVQECITTCIYIVWSAAVSK